MSRLGDAVSARRRAFVQVPSDFFQLNDADRDAALEAMVTDTLTQLGIDPRPPSSPSRGRRRGRPRTS
jgi:hypothetical protein